MEINLDKIDDTILGLLWLTRHDERRAWKSFDCGALDRLHQKCLIADPATKGKSVVLSDDDPPLNFHPAGVRASAIFTPVGAV
jgi:hypothetical protein